MKLFLSLLVPFVLVAVKVLGVWWAARTFGPKLFPAAKPSPMKVAWVRLALGLVGAAIAYVVGQIVGNSLTSEWAVEHSSEIGTGVGFGAHFALRLVAWLIVVKVFYDRPLANRRSVAISVLGGTALSYLLDVPNVLLALADLAWLFKDVRFC